MVLALRIVLPILALAWAIPGFALIDLSILFVWNAYFLSSMTLEVSWGALFTFFVVVPLIATAIEPARWRETVVLDGLVTVALSVAAIAAGDAGTLWAAGAVVVTTAVVAWLGRGATRADAAGPPAAATSSDPASTSPGPAPRRHPYRPRPWLGLDLPLLVLAIAAVPLWAPYVVHAIAEPVAQVRYESIGIDHWPVQAACGIATVLAVALAASGGRVRALASVAAALTAVTVGLSVAQSQHYVMTTEPAAWGTSTVLWGVAVLLALRWSELRRRRAVVRP